MKRLLVIVRHGDGSSELSDQGRLQIRNLKKIIETRIAEVFEEEKVRSIYFSFSFLERAFQSAKGLAFGGDVIVTDLYLTERRGISYPERILEKVLAIADCYCAQVITIVAHGDMPSVIAETAYEYITGKQLSEQLCNVGKACGYVIDMNTGEIVFITHEPPRPDPIVRKPITTGFSDDYVVF